MRTGLLVLAIMILSAAAAQANKAYASTSECSQLAAEMDRSIETELLDKFIVTQACHTWKTAKVAQLFLKVPYYLECSENGFRLLQDVISFRSFIVLLILKIFKFPNFQISLISINTFSCLFSMDHPSLPS